MTESQAQLIHAGSCSTHEIARAKPGRRAEPDIVSFMTRDVCTDRVDRHAPNTCICSRARSADTRKAYHRDPGFFRRPDWSNILPDTTPPLEDISCRAAVDEASADESCTARLMIFLPPAAHSTCPCRNLWGTPCCKSYLGQSYGMIACPDRRERMLCPHTAFFIGDATTSSSSEAHVEQYELSILHEDYTHQALRYNDSSPGNLRLLFHKSYRAPVIAMCMVGILGLHIREPKRCAVVPSRL